MPGGPLDGETQGAGGEAPVDDLKALDRDLDLELPVLGMEVGRVMIIEVHPDDDPKESRDLGHRETVDGSACLRLTRSGG